MRPAPAVMSSDLRVGGVRNPGRRVLRDFTGVALMVILSLAAGLAMNRFSSRPLPIVYQTPEQRFDAELTSLVTVPPFQITPAATLGLAQFRSAVESKSALIFDARPSAFFLEDTCRGP